MGFEKHLFISYAHIDNQPLTPEQQGWVSRFHTSLEAMLSMRLGRKAQIWRDAKLAGNDIFAEEIVDQFPKTAVLVSILTPRYIESDWCTREVGEFCKAATQNGGVVLDNKARIVKVIKTPVDNEGPLPPVMKQVLGYPFFIVDEEQTPIELDPAYGAEIAQKYNLKIAKLAWDIAQVLKKLDTTPVAGATLAPSGPAKPAIYLAECAYDRREAREALEAELRLEGYRVLPDKQLPIEEDEYLAEVRAMLDSCKLSIHLIGGAYGAVPDGPGQKSVGILQNELAIEKSRAAGLRRVIWLPENTRPANAAQQAFVDALRGDAAAQFGADLITADLETLKGAVHSALKKLEEPPKPKLVDRTSVGTSRLIYLICDERDRKATIPLRKFLKNRGHDVEIPVFEGDASEVRRTNQDMLTQCDAVLVFYGSGDEAWRRSVESDIRKIKGARADRPLSADYIYLAEPATGDKKDLIELEEADLVNGLDGFAESSLTAFLAALERV